MSAGRAPAAPWYRLAQERENQDFVGAAQTGGPLIGSSPTTCDIDAAADLVIAEVLARL